MRLHSLHLQGDTDAEVLVHPRLTVIAGLADDVRRRFVDACASLADGVESAEPGLVYAAGIRIAFDPDPWRRPVVVTPADFAEAGIDVGTDAEFAFLADADADADASTTIESESEPATGAEPAPESEFAPFPGAEFAFAAVPDIPNPEIPHPETDSPDTDGPEPDGGTAPVGLDERLADAREAMDAAVARFDAEVATAVLAEAEFRGAAEAHLDIRRRLDDARRRLDPEAGAALEESRATLDACRRNHGGGATGLAELVAHRDRLQDRLDEHRRTLERIRSADSAKVATAADTLRRSLLAGPVPDAEAVALADRWGELQAHLATLEAKLEAEGGGTESASHRLELARVRLADAEARVAPRHITSQDVEELEKAHEKVLRCERKLAGRFGAGRARRQLDTARAKEQEILDRMGFPTWSAYIMGTTLSGIDPEARAEVEIARAEYEAAELAWNDLAARLNEDPEFLSLLDQLEAVHMAATDLLGEDIDDADELEAALRARRIVVDDPGVSPAEAAEELTTILRAVEVDPGYAARHEQLLDQAEEWLTEMRLLTRQQRRIELEADGVEAELGELEATRRRLEDEGGDGTWEPPELAAARAAVADAEDRLEAHRVALDQVADLIARVESLAEDQQSIAERVDRQEGRVAASIERLIDTATRVFTLELAAGSSVDQLALPLLVAARADDDRRSVPLVFDGVPSGPDGLDATLGAIAMASELAQVLVLSDQPAVVLWAAGLDEDEVTIVGV